MQQLTDSGAAGRGRRGGRIPLESSGPAEQNEPRTNITRRPLLPNRRHRRQRVTAPRPRTVLLLLNNRVHHRVGRRQAGPSDYRRLRLRASLRRMRCGSRRREQGIQGGRAVVIGVGRIVIRFRRHRRVHVHRRQRSVASSSSSSSSEIAGESQLQEWDSSGAFWVQRPAVDITESSPPLRPAADVSDRADFGLIPPLSPLIRTEFANTKQIQNSKFDGRIKLGKRRKSERAEDR